MRRLSSLLLIGALTSCASHQDIRTFPVDESFIAKAYYRDVGDCIASTLYSELGGFYDILHHPTESPARMTITKRFPTLTGQPTHMIAWQIAVLDEMEKSRIEIRSVRSVLGSAVLDERVEGIIKTCANAASMKAKR